ncbi:MULTISPECIES: restriction endonuclease subunit S [Romboutsia]|uniref:restriction endonuclease subunit S n=1 Tax=Romboutsia TaxID=1501226 RepID=UPI00216DFB38|nr:MULTISPECIES: restriction endonuclease subunit S [Romboutsia]MCI9260040.1 hypothetical protein [Romboutsia sp.]
MIENIDKMNGWSIEELPNLVFFQEGPGVRNNQYTDSGVKLLNVANLKDGNVYLDNTDRYISEEEAYGKYSHFLVDEGDLIIASSGIKVEYFDKKMGFAKKEHLPLCMNTSTIRFKTLDDNILDIEYFAYFLKTNYFKKQISRLITGSAQLNFGPSHLKQIKVILPPIETQKKIVEALDKAQELIDKRREQIEALGELVKSRFIEMFGDPVKNPKEWNKVNIGSKFEIKTGATPSRKENTYWENGTIPWVKTTELKEVIINETEEYITQDGYDNSSVNLLPKETLLIAMYGQGKTRGMTGKLGIEATTNQACAAILPNSEENMDFVWYQLKLSYEDLRSLGRGGSQPNLNTNLIKSYELIFPPMKLQNQFVDFVNQVDKLKSQMETSLKELEDNFNSLMQKAFKGELF